MVFGFAWEGLMVCSHSGRTYPEGREFIALCCMSPMFSCRVLESRVSHHTVQYSASLTTFSPTPDSTSTSQRWPDK